MDNNDYLYPKESPGPKFSDALGKSHTLTFKKVEFGDALDNAIHKPTAMSWPEVVVWANNKVREEESPVTVSEELQAFPFEAAYGIDVVMRDRFGMSQAVGRGQVVKFPVDARGNSVEVNIGSFTVPTIDGTWSIQPDFIKNTATLSCDTKHKFKARVNEAIAQVKQYLRENSLYKGRALRIHVEEHPFFGEIIQPPEFMDVTKGTNLILNASTERLVTAKVFNALTRYKRLKAINVPFRRGILVYGVYGTGKTLMANEAARLAQENGITFFYVKDITDLARIYQFAARYAPTVVFAEDLDQLVKDATSISSIFDGVDTKANEIMLIVTTNHEQTVAEQAAVLLRPGRIDAAIPFPPPDAISAAKLVAQFGGPYLSPNVDLERLGIALAGQIPAVIREVVERSKEFVILEDEDTYVQTEDILLMFDGMKPHLDLLNTPPRKDPSQLQDLGDAIGHYFENAVKRSKRENGISTTARLSEMAEADIAERFPEYDQR